MPINSVQQKNLHEIIKKGCVRVGINRARTAAKNIVKNLRASLEQKAERVGKKYDRRIEKIEAKKAAMQKNYNDKVETIREAGVAERTVIEEKIQELKDLQRKSRHADEKKIKKIDDQSAEKAKAFDEQIDQVIQDALETDFIERGKGESRWNSVRCRNEEGPDMWVIHKDHPDGEKITQKSKDLQTEITDMEHELERIQRELWLATDDAGARALIDELKALRKRYTKIIKQDPSTATLPNV